MNDDFVVRALTMCPIHYILSNIVLHLEFNPPEYNVIDMRRSNCLPTQIGRLV